MGLVPIAGTHPLASNNQFLPGERDFRGCGFISARLESSCAPECFFLVRLARIYRRSGHLYGLLGFWNNSLFFITVGTSKNPTIKNGRFDLEIVIMYLGSKSTIVELCLPSAKIICYVYWLQTYQKQAYPCILFTRFIVSVKG